MMFLAGISLISLVIVGLGFAVLLPRTPGQHRARATAAPPPEPEPVVLTKLDVIRAATVHLRMNIRPEDLDQEFIEALFDLLAVVEHLETRANFLLRITADPQRALEAAAHV
jgi:hypothetical protein